MVGTTRFYELYDYVKKECYDEILDRPAPIREAILFYEILKRMPIEIKPEDHIAGWYGYESMPEGIPSISEAAKENEKYIDYSEMSKREIKEQFDFYFKFATLSTYRAGHTCVDYGELINHGLDWYRDKIEKNIKKAKTGSEEEIYLSAMLIALDACEMYAMRFSNLAKELADKEKDPLIKEKYLRMYETNRRVPMKPARDFYEAIQAIWTIHALTPISDNNWYSISMGRLDQYLYPFYEKSIKDGETDENIKAYLKNVFLLLDNFGDGSCAVNLGGLSYEGEDQYNHLSDLILDVELESNLRSPLIAVRMTKKTPDDVWMKIIDPRLFSIGKPAIYNEEECRKAMMYRGIPEREAATYTVSSCMALVMAGDETSDMWGCIFNMHLPLELTVNGGKPFHGELPFELKTKPLERINSMDDIHEKYEEYFREILAREMKISLKTEKHHALNFPNPLLSVLTRGCIEKGVDRMWGAKYRTTIVETFGIANTANALCAIEKLVFDEKKYTLPELVSATINDFEGFEGILKDIKGCDKFGTDSDLPDSHAVRLFNMVEKVCKDMYYDNVKYVPSLHTLDVNVQMGVRLGTTMDGRMKCTPVAKNGGPTNDVRRPDPTSLMLSAAKYEQYKFTGGNPIDLNFDKRILSDEDTRRKIAALFKTYFELGGMQIQVNAIDSKTLKLAYEKPEDYNHLIVKIGGYSMRFNDMTDEKKREFIERAEYEEGSR